MSVTDEGAVNQTDMVLVSAKREAVDSVRIRALCGNASGSRLPGWRGSSLEWKHEGRDFSGFRFCAGALRRWCVLCLAYPVADGRTNQQ